MVELHSIKKRLLIAFSLGVLAGCGRWTPMASERSEAREEIARMYVSAVTWPDTVQLGETQRAEVVLLLPSGRPLVPEYVYWKSENVDVVGLYPTRVAESKYILGTGPGKTTVITRAFYRPQGDEHFLSAELRREVVVVP